MTGTDASSVRVHAIAVTYRRPKLLRSTLQSFFDQTRPPDSILVIDNGEAGDARDVVSEWENTGYLAMDENLGPAGGYASGMREVLRRCGSSDWILLIDDDDPAKFGWAVEELLLSAERAPADVAAIGLTGARYGRHTGLLRRVLDSELSEWTDVDVIGNGQLPLYRSSALREVGCMNPNLFFGLEELELGLRLRSRGWRLVVTDGLTMHARQVSGRTGLGSRAPSDLKPANWRLYYSTRNELLIARSFASWTAPFAITLRVIAGGALNAARSRSASALKPRALGLRHGWLGRVGRTVDPQVARGN